MSSSSINAGEFKAGFAKVAITPVAHQDVVDTLEAGPRTVGDISDPLYIKALILTDGLSRIAMITLDLMDVPPMAFAELLGDIRERSSFDQVFLSITHTHSGYLGNYDYAALKEKIALATRTADQNSQPVKIGAAAGQLDEAYNRIMRQPGKSAEMLWTNPTRKANRDVDQSVLVINFKTLKGETLLNIVNYSAHPVVTMDLKNVVVSADYPGQLAEGLQQRGEGETLFLLGAAGDINPYDANTKPTALSLEKSHELGEKLALEVINTVRAIKSHQASGRFSFNNLRYSLTVIKPGDWGPAPAEINTLMLTDDVALASFSGEFFNQFGTTIKQQSPTKHTLFLGYTNGALGYIPTKEAVQFGGYGADTSSMWFDVETGTNQVHAAIRSLKALNQARAGDH